MDGVPLRLRLAPGTYRVRWSLVGDDGTSADLEGDLELRADERPRGNLYEGVPIRRKMIREGSWYSQLPQTRHEDVLRGRLLNAMQVTLLDVEIVMWEHNRAVITAAAALVGGPLSGAFDGGVASVLLQVTGLDAVAGIAPVKRVKLPKREGARYLDWSWHADGNPDSTQSWSDDEADVELRFESSVTAPEGYFYRVSFSPVVQIQFDKRIPFREMVEKWIEPLRRIVSLSTGRREEVTYLEIASSDFEGPQDHLQAYGSHISQVPYASRENSFRAIHRSFTFAQETLSMLSMLRTWQDLDNNHHPLLETYASLMYAPAQHPRSRLLLLLQALEGLHGFEFRAVYESRTAKHERERNDALTKIAASDIDAATKRFIRHNLTKRPATGLDQVLREALAGLPHDITGDLAATDLIRSVMSDPRNPAGPFDALRIVRNDLAHGNKGYDAEHLYDVVALLDAAVRAHLLRLLGCDTDSQRTEQDRAHQ